MSTKELRDRIKRLDEVDIDKIVEFEAGNPVDRTDDDRSQLDSSLDINGYVMPVEVRELENGTFETLDGHGRLERIRAKFPGTKKLKVVVLDVATREEGRKILLGLRRQARWGLDDLNDWMADALDEGLDLDEAMNLSALTAADLSSFATAGEAALSNLPDVPPPTDEHEPSSPRPLTSAERAARVFIFDQRIVADAAFQHYRFSGFPYPDPSPAECMLSINRLASMSLEALLRTHEGYAVADKFQPHRFAANADGMISPLASFGDDKKLRYVIDMTIDQAGTISDGALRSKLGMVQGGQTCANFRPGFAAYLYRRFCVPGGTVLDTSAGYGGRLVGALGSAVVKHYVGIDPNEPSIDGSRRLLALLDRESFATLIQDAAEDVPIDRLENRCDFSFTSPPYFTKERYSDDPKQSSIRYPHVDVWREKFLVPMMELTFWALKPGSHAAINIADVMIEGVRHPLGNWTVMAANRAGFEHVGTLDFPVGGARHFGGMKVQGREDEATEPVFLFQRP